MPPSQPWVERAHRERFPYWATRNYLIRTPGLPVSRAEPVAEDAVQQAFAQIMGWTFASEDTFRSLWFRMARFRARDGFGWDNRHPQMPDETDVGAEQPDRVAVTEQLDWAMAQLSEEEQKVVRLYYFGGLKFAQIGTVCNISTSAAFKRVQAALARLREILCQDNEPA